ncbi:MAG: hypothetical protein KDJ15_05855 [Alphaproteobacteria bacterium]|nr:hypothetical protein [Alphaproteobacteria bacterium]
MTSLWSSKEADNVTGGLSTMPWQAQGIATAPGSVRPGDLFVLLGVSGRDDLKQAFERGAAGAVVSIWPAGMEKTHPLMIVDDPLAALHRLAAAGLKRCGARRISVRGRARDGLGALLAAALQTVGAVATVRLAAGHMMTDLAALPPGADYVLLEEAPGSSCESMEIATSLSVSAPLAVEALETVRLQAYLEAANGTRLRAFVGKTEIVLNLPVPGRGVALQALAALEVTAALGGDLPKAARALERSRGRESRGYGAAAEENPVVLLSDTVSVSCARSTKAFRVLAMVDPGRGAKRIAILSHLSHEAANDWGGDWAALPGHTADVRLVYTRAPGTGKNVIQTDMQQIVPDILAPGDVMMLSKTRDLTMEVLRAPEG